VKISAKAIQCAIAVNKCQRRRRKKAGMREKSSDLFNCENNGNIEEMKTSNGINIFESEMAKNEKKSSQ
jgi:hypothetical protein